jgi:endonuclease/exonuclease/phosphatase family metal-dependent hydrolase
VDTTAGADATAGPDAQPQDAAAESTVAPPDAAADAAPEVPTPDDWPAMTVGTWNLENFSAYGAAEFRLDDITATIQQLAPDILAIQELKVADGTDGSPPQAWDALLAGLPAYAGLHAPWDLGQDTTVGLIYRTDAVTVLSSKTLFEGDWYAFPRPPLQVSVRVEKDGGAQWAQFDLVVVHLKAFGDSWERRLDACAKLHAYVQGGGTPSAKVVVLGDFNDSPFDAAPEPNVFAGTFLDNAPTWHFVTASLPHGTVSSTGYFHYVGATWVEGEFLDHVMVTGPLHQPYAAVTPAVHGVPPAQYDTWSYEVSDHFPVVVTFTP